MAKTSVRMQDLQTTAEQFARLERTGIKRIVAAGARALEDRMREDTAEAGHVRNKDMLNSIAATEFREWLGGGSQEVYPQGVDRKGERNATKAYVINYGRGRRRKKNRDGSRNRMADQFITGDALMEPIVLDAMQAESDKIINEIGGE